MIYGQKPSIVRLFLVGVFFLAFSLPGYAKLPPEQQKQVNTRLTALWTDHTGAVDIKKAMALTLQAMQTVLDQGADINTKSIDGSTILMVAESPQVTRFLLRHGASVDARDHMGYTALMRAPTAAIAQLLLARGADFQVRSYHGESVLSLAAFLGHPEVVKWALAHGADMTMRSEQGNTVLIDVAMPEVVQILLDHHCDVNAKTDLGETALMRAASRDRPDIVQLLLKHGATVNTRDHSGETALMAIAEFSKDVYNYGGSGRHPYLGTVEAHHAAVAHVISDQKARVRVFTLLLDAGADVNLSSVSSALAKVATSGMTDWDVDTDAEANRFKTALFTAQNDGDRRVIQILLDHGAKIDAKDSEGMTALIGAALIGHPAMVDLLLCHGADINARDNEGKTALIWAVSQIHSASGAADMDAAVLKRCTAIIHLLVDHGADVNAKDKKGQTALSIATQRGEKEIVDLLKAAGAKPPNL